MTMNGVLQMDLLLHVQKERVHPVNMMNILWMAK
jgi:hypothetical protein